MSYLIHQFRLSDEASDHLNSVGWGGDFGDFPEIAIQRDVSFSGGSEKYESWMGDHYKAVARVSGTQFLEDVFHIGNGFGVDGASIQKFCRMHSVSVGDIIVNEKCGTAWMVDGEGWSNIDFGRMF